MQLLGSDVVHVPKRPGEPDYSRADISQIQRMLGWHPTTSFEEGVRIMLDNIDYWQDTPLWTPETISEVTREWFAHLAK